MAQGSQLTIEVELHHDKIREYLRDDLDYIATTLMPEEAIYPFPPFYRQVWALILSNLWTLPIDEVFRFALGLPRGHVKTNFLKILVCYLVIHDYDIDFILIACATEPLAENFLSDIHDMLKTPIITDLYGSWEASLSRSTMKVKVSSFQGRPIILAAIGAGTSIRGLNLKRKRPQIIINDDVQTRENDESDTERSKLLRWLLGTLFKSRSKVTKSAIIWVGNMYSTECILYQFSRIPNWTSLITGGILADGTALWPELNTVEELLEEYEHDAALGEARTWFAEIQNDPVGAATGLLDANESIPKWQEMLEGLIELYKIRFITVDPAGQKKTSDDNVVATHAIGEEEQGITLEIANGKWNPGETVQDIIRQALTYKVPIVFIESNAYQITLAYWLNLALEKLGLMDIITVVPLNSGAASKPTRIKAFVKQWAANKWRIIDRNSYNKTIYQLYAYRTTKTNNIDDILDVLAQAILALSKHYQDILDAAENQFEETQNEYQNVRVLASNTVLDAIRRHSV